MQNLLNAILQLLQEIEDEKTLSIIYSFVLGLTQDDE